MPRKKKSEEVVSEVIEPMKNDALNEPVTITNSESDDSEPSVVSVQVKPVEKIINCNASLINVRDGEEGNVLYTLKNKTKILVESEQNGWAKIIGYVKSDLISDK